MPDFQLSAQLKGHDADVRAVAFPTANTVLSSSRDSTVRLWRKTADKPPKFDATLTSQGNGYINSLAFFRPTQQWPDGFIVSAGQETIIEVKRPTLTATDNADRLLVGHGHNVCALDMSPRGDYLVSGGWDGKAIVWGTDKWEIKVQLAHEGEVRSVWAVLAYDEHTVITGSADTYVRIFDLRKVNHNGEVDPIRTLSTGTLVRALCKLPTGLKGHPSGAEFASAGNDGIIRLWKLNGTEVGTLQGHDSFIYSLGCLPSADIVSAGEDRTVRIWRGSECIQTITHPAISVWAVAVCPENGDIVSGASDNVVRVFTRSPERTADLETLSQFEESVRSSAIPAQQIETTINKEKLKPASWLLNNPGSKDGQVTTVLEENNTIGAYQWSLSQQKWIHVGTVVDSTGSSGRKVEYQGREYDYVFDVDIEEGKPPLKLPYNLSENPFEAATKFLGDNELPISYLDQVAQFITTNTKGATIGQTSDAPSTDPYGIESSVPESTNKFLPYTEYLSISQAKWEPAVKKLKSLNEKHLLAGNKHIALNPDGVNGVEEVLQAAMGSSPSQKAKGLPGLNSASQNILSIITQWPYADRLPALDALRCLVIWPGVASVNDSTYGNVVKVALKGALDSEQPVQHEDKSLAEFARLFKADSVNANNVMLSLRTVTNLFSTEEGRRLAVEESAGIITILARIAGLMDNLPPIGKENNNLQIALTSAIFNYSCLTFKESGAATLDILSGVCEIAVGVISQQSDAEVLFRAVMALGMILAAGGQGKSVAKALGVGGAIGEAAKKSGELRIQTLARECMVFLRQ
ncbi:ubiquitin homeostasis protein lub1 [Podospora fimiseda]|uniref:Ubiquitin homeostasis protein lub1 n=1 Tax=Podospora fimiseda TaxID=252190 RepID=A0AAN7BWL3_9PEZI|nr:ubiquitin homeostasis protein lub1 [Podospora fimiseda]